MRLLHGLVLWAVIAILLSGSAGCKKDSPPKIDVCIGDGFGAADCLLREGSRLRALCKFHNDENGAGWYCPPSALENAWITTAEDMESFSQFCYGASKKTVRAHMQAYRQAMFKR